MAVLEIKSRNKYWKRAVDTPLMSHLPSEKNYVLLIYLGLFDFQNGRCPATNIGRGQSTPLFYHTVLTGNKAYVLLIYLGVSDVENSRFGNQMPATNIGGGLSTPHDTPILSHFPFGGISLPSPNLPWGF